MITTANNTVTFKYLDTFSRKEITAGVNATLKTVLENNEIDLDGRTIQVNGVTVLPMMTLAEAKIKNGDFVSTSVKASSGSVATANGPAICITSSLTRAQWQTVLKYGDPECAVLYADEKKTQKIFEVTFADGVPGLIGEEFIIFSELNANEKFPTVAELLTEPLTPEEIKELYGPVVLKLNKVEDQVSAALEAALANEEQVMDAIEVI